MNTALASAARAMLDAFGGDFPDHLRGEAAALADELAAIEGEAEGPHMAAIAHMRAAERFAREIADCSSTFAPPWRPSRPTPGAWCYLSPPRPSARPSASPSGPIPYRQKEESDG
jgi:hypothetical protein